MTTSRRSRVPVARTSHASSCQRTRATSVGRRERALVPPAAGQPFAVLGLGFHDHPGAAQAERRRDGPASGRRASSPRTRLRRRGSAGGSSSIDSSQLVGWHGRHRLVLHLPARQTVGERTRGDRSGRAPRRSGSSANAPRVRSPSRASRSTSSTATAVRAASTEPASTVTGHGARNAGDVPGGTTTTSTRSAPRWPAPRAPPRTCRRRCRRARRAPRARARGRRSASPTRRHPRSTRDGPRVGNDSCAGSFEHEARHELLHRPDDELERARVGRVVGVEHHEARAARLRPRGAATRRPHPPSRASADAERTTSPRGAAVGDHHRRVDEPGIPAAGRDDRPVGAPQAAQRPGGGTPSSVPADGSARRGRARRHAGGPPRPGPPPAPAADGRRGSRRARVIHGRPTALAPSACTAKAAPAGHDDAVRLRGDQHRLPLPDPRHQAAGVAQPPLPAAPRPAPG